MEENNTYPKSYSLDYELKSKIAYEALCENYSKQLINDLMSYLHIEIEDLADEEVVKKILGLFKINN